ncbi:hypothetical protein SBY92_003228 [Candida maltosa Xu316]
MLCLIERHDDMTGIMHQLHQLFSCKLVHVDKYVDEFNWLGLLCKL